MIFVTKQRKPYISVNESNDVPEHVVEEALRLGFYADTGISFRDPEPEEKE